MPIAQSEIKYCYTGGAANSDPAASLGGAISSVEIPDAALRNLFDNVSGDESASGDVEYRCIGVRHANASIVWEAVRAYITANTPAAGDTIEIGVEVPGVGGAVQAIANEGAAPVGVAFSAPTARASGLVLSGNGDTEGNLSPGKWCALWIRRTVTAGATAYNNNAATLRVDGDTAS